MPTAQSFTTLGAGNGFSFCPEVINVNDSQWEHWTTASGFNKDSGGSPSAASIEESRRLAMHWFWNLHKIEADLSVNWDGTGASVGDQIVRDDNDDPITPKDRICNGDDLSFGEDDGDYDYAELHASAGVCALYSGSSFLGYGIVGAEAWCYDGDAFFDAYVEFGCITEKAGDGSNAWKTQDVTYGTINLGGQSIHVVKYAAASDFLSATKDVTVNASTLSAIVNYDANAPSTEISGFEAYTY